MAEDFVFRPHFPNECRDLAPELTRTAVFVIAIGREPGEKREADKPKITEVDLNE